VSIGVRDLPASPAAASGGGLAARRAVIRWAWRLLRREWRQQLLILALIIVAVAATFVGAAVATTTPVPATATFGTAQDSITLYYSGSRLAAQIAVLQHRFGRVDVIENQALQVPGTVFTYDLRAQKPHGPFGGPMLSLQNGRYPATPSQVAMTSALASQLHLRVGDTWRADGRSRQVVGLVQNPQNLLDAFALVLPGQVTTPTQTTVLFDAPGVDPSSIGRNVSTPARVASSSVVNPETVSLTAAMLGMLLIALVGVGGFTVLAQRRLRSIGMLGAQGATDRNIRLVIRANGAATGVVGAVAGFAVGLLAWLAYRPSVESHSNHLIGVFQLPWLVIIVAMVLAVLAAYFAAAHPARAVARVPIVAALSGRPAAPRKTRSWALPAGLVFLAIAFILLGVAGSTLGGGADGSGSQNLQLGSLVFGFLALTVAVVLLSPALLGLLARVARPAPVAVRLALRDLARYRARSGAALGAISLSLLIAVIIIVLTAARFADVLDYVGPNLASNQLVVYPPSPQTVPGSGTTSGPAPRQGAGPNGADKVKERKARAAAPTLSAAQIAAATATARGIAAALGTSDVITLETASASLQRAAAGRNWNGYIYVATPQLLRAFGISPSQVSPDADIVTMRPGLSTLSKMQLIYGTLPCAGTARGCPPGPSGTDSTLPCLNGHCVNNPVIQQLSALPSGTSAPNTLITERAIRQLGLGSSISIQGELIQTAQPLTASQIHSAQQAAAASGASVETRNSIPPFSEILDVATLIGIVLALGILAMSVGLVRSETASDLRTLTATGASSLARRTITAATAGALALAGAVTGLFCAYLAAIGFFRTNQLDGLSELSSIPVANLLMILVGLPLVAVIAGWLLAGRQPPAIGRQPME
jgi:putative ABC transport system permease protein